MMGSADLWIREERRATPTKNKTFLFFIFQKSLKEVQANQVTNSYIAIFK